MIIDERESLEYKRIKDTYAGVIFTDIVDKNVRLYNGNGDILPFTIENSTGSIILSGDTVNADAMKIKNDVKIDNLTSFNITTDKMQSNDCYLTIDGTLSNHAVKVEQVNNIFTNIVTTANKITNEGQDSSIQLVANELNKNTTEFEFKITQDMIDNNHYIIYIISCNFQHSGNVQINRKCNLVRKINGYKTILTTNDIQIQGTWNVDWGADVTTFIHTEKIKDIMIKNNGIETPITANTTVKVTCEFDNNNNISIYHLDALILNGE